MRELPTLFRFAAKQIPLANFKAIPSDDVKEEVLKQRTLAELFNYWEQSDQEDEILRSVGLELLFNNDNFLKKVLQRCLANSRFLTFNPELWIKHLDKIINRDFINKDDRDEIEIKMLALTIKILLMQNHPYDQEKYNLDMKKLSLLCGCVGDDLRIISEIFFSYLNPQSAEILNSSLAQLQIELKKNGLASPSTIATCGRILPYLTKEPFVAIVKLLIAKFSDKRALEMVVCASVFCEMEVEQRDAMWDALLATVFKMAEESDHRAAINVCITVFPLLRNEQREKLLESLLTRLQDEDGGARARIVNFCAGLFSLYNSEQREVIFTKLLDSGRDDYEWVRVRVIDACVGIFPHLTNTQRAAVWELLLIRVKDVNASVKNALRSALADIHLASAMPASLNLQLSKLGKLVTSLTTASWAEKFSHMTGEDRASEFDEILDELQDREASFFRRQWAIECVVNGFPYFDESERGRALRSLLVEVEFMQRTAIDERYLNACVSLFSYFMEDDRQKAFSLLLDHQKFLRIIPFLNLDECRRIEKYISDIKSDEDAVDVEASQTRSVSPQLTLFFRPSSDPGVAVSEDSELHDKLSPRSFG